MLALSAFDPPHHSIRSRHARPCVRTGALCYASAYAYHGFLPFHESSRIEPSGCDGVGMRRSASPRHRSHKINLSFGAVLGRAAAQNRAKRRPKCRVLCAVKRAYRITKANVPIVTLGMTHERGLECSFFVSVGMLLDPAFLR